MTGTVRRAAPTEGRPLVNTRTQTIRAAIYARVSTAGQVDGTSLDEQRSICEAAILSRGWEVAGEYVDEGLSGTSRERPEWSRMLGDCRSGAIQAVVVAKLDRFARKAADAITETDRFSDLGVTLVVVKEQIDMSTPAGRMMRTMLAGVAEMERDLIVDRTVAGQRAKGRNGQWPGGQPPFGWKLEGTKRDARPVPDGREREVVSVAYDLLVKKHLTSGQVADRLNDSGLLPRKAERWNPDVLRRTLANETLHTGRVIWGAPESGSIYKRSHHTKLDRNGNPVYGDPIELTLPEPPITAQQHRAVMRALAKRSTRGLARAPKTQLLSTRLTSECGQHYIGVSLAAKDYDVYRCSGRKHLRGAEKCQCKQVQAQALDARVWVEVAHLLGDPARLEAMARQWLEVPEQSDDLTERAVAGIEKEIAKLERGRNNATRELLLADNPEPIREVLGDIERELNELKDRRAAYAALQNSATATAQKLTDIARLAERAKGRLESMPPAQRREVIEILDVRVTMHGPIEKSEPESITITGQIDPRLFDDGSASTSSEDVGPQPSSPTAGNHEQGDDGRDGVLRGSGPAFVSNQCHQFHLFPLCLASSCRALSACRTACAVVRRLAVPPLIPRPLLWSCSASVVPRADENRWRTFTSC
jgi:site-specific DNA recombinase